MPPSPQSFFFNLLSAPAAIYRYEKLIYNAQNRGGSKKFKMRGPKHFLERAQHRFMPTTLDWHPWDDQNIPLDSWLQNFFKNLIKGGRGPLGPHLNLPMQKSSLFCGRAFGNKGPFLSQLEDWNS